MLTFSKIVLKSIDKIYTLVYTIYRRDCEVSIMETVKLFANGQSQAVRLPKSYRFEGEEVYAQKIGHTVMLFPKNTAWATFLDGLKGFSEDFMAGDRESIIEQERELL